MLWGSWCATGTRGMVLWVSQGSTNTHGTMLWGPQPRTAGRGGRQEVAASAAPSGQGSWAGLTAQSPRAEPGTGQPIPLPPHQGNGLRPRATRGAVSSATSPCSSLRLLCSSWDIALATVATAATATCGDKCSHGQATTATSTAPPLGSCRTGAGFGPAAEQGRDASGVRGVTARSLHRSRCLGHRSAAECRRSVPPGGY